MGNRIRGVLAPVITPFNQKGEVDIRRLETHCHWLRKYGVGLAILGTNSEANSLSLAERLNLMEALFETDIERKAFMPGTGACDLPTAVALTRAATCAGCAGVLTLPPFYYKGVSDEGLYAFYSELIEQVGEESLRVYLYHIPQVAQVNISIGLIERLLKAYPQQIAGIKDSSGDWHYTQTLLNSFKGEQFDVFPGSERFLLAGLREGAAGCISATANINPAAIIELYTHWQTKSAERLQVKLNEVRDIFEQFPMIPALKTTIAHWSQDSQWRAVRPPFLPLQAKDRQSLLNYLSKVGFNIQDVS